MEVLNRYIEKGTEVGCHSDPNDSFINNPTYQFASVCYEALLKLQLSPNNSLL